MSNNKGSRPDYSRYMDTKEGWVDRRIFWEREIYEQELEQIFAKAWQFIAHDSMLPETNDFYTTYMGEDGVIASRQKDGSVRVFLNSCTHRGNKICYADDGNTRNFTCNYHGWAFGTDGELKGLSNEHVYDEGDIDKSKWGLQQARVDSYKGLIFATFDEEAPSLEEFLGDFRWYLDIMLDQDDGGTEFIGGGIKNYVNANWKFGVENFVGDAYHALWTHDSGFKAMNNNQGFPPADPTGSYHASVNGHGWEFGTDGLADIAILGQPKVLEYYEKMRPKMAERLGEMRSKIFGSLASVSLFPNCSFLPGIQTFRVWLPRGPHKFEMRMWTIVNKNMPDEIKQAINIGCMQTFNPAGVLEMDDGENWEGNTSVNKGVVTRKGKLHYGCGKNRRIEHEELPGIVYSSQFNDSNQRLFYQRWADMMNADKWSDVPTRYTPRYAGKKTV
jgi:ethylbenzene dioxygenase alpha subunit